MSLVYVLPAVVFVVGAIVLLLLGREASRAASELGQEAARWGELEPALVRVARASGRVRATVERRPRR